MWAQICDLPQKRVEDLLEEEDAGRIMAEEKKDARSGKAPRKESQPLIIAKTPAEEQRLKLERLMRNPVS